MAAMPYPLCEKPSCHRYRWAVKSKSQRLQKEELRNGQLWFQLLGSRSVEKHTLQVFLRAAKEDYGAEG